ncbi:MAG TPA: hypothetical protein VNQ56_08505 [Pseudolabrys sp.]|nr:hypothetical protein [Pseudolabrys sp.]
MTWDFIQQVVCIVAYAAGGYHLGDAVAQSAQFQAAVGGVLRDAVVQASPLLK